MTTSARARLAILAASALASALLPAFAAAAEAGCKYVQVARLPLRYAGPDLNITTQGTINGTPATMLVDTGAFATILTTQATEPRKLALRNTGSEAAGIGGHARIYSTQVDEFSIGPARSGRMTLPVVKEFGGAPGYDALVGAPFLLQTDLEISLATKELKFFRPMGCGDAFLGYWDENAVVLPFNQHMRDPANPHFTVVVNGVKMDAIIDTGAGASYVSLGAAKRAGLKLDASKLTRTLDVTGAGPRKVASWHTTFERFEIGNQVVRNAQVGVVDDDGAFEVLLGADFLRSHRVLFAMSQQKIYLSYIGGQPFGQGTRLEPWLQAEAEAGNADAQMVLSTYYIQGKVVPQDMTLAAHWGEKAANGGNADAKLISGRSMMLIGMHAQAVTRLRAGLDKPHGYPQAPLWLYIARVHTGQAELAKTELAAARQRNRENEWPAPIADFYLGKLGAAKLIEEARDDRTLATARTCESISAMEEWHSAHGDRAALPALAAQGARAGCPLTPAALTNAAPQPEP
ncbi:MAG: hypothetical protein JWP72_648 [Massilia sp.]|nr:hypothetical protein [Massilia sp.]